MDTAEQVNSNDDQMMGSYLSSILDVGELLLMCGAEVSRVEDTIMRLCRAYGFIRSDVFTITSSIVATAILPGGKALTQTRRIYQRGRDLGGVAMLNALSRKTCAHPLELRDFQQEIDRIRHRKTASPQVNLAMYMMISASLSVFFGGTWTDGLAAAISGSVLYATVWVSSRLKMNSLVQNLMCSAITALAVMILVRAGIGQHPDKITIGNIMLVIPGIQFTTSLRDMINGDTISGLLNMSEAVLQAISVAMGFALVLILGGMG